MNGGPDISARLLGGVDVLDIPQRVSVETHLVLRHRFREAIQRGRRKFVLNLRDTAALDSMMVGELVACGKRARERGGDLRLVVASESIVHHLLQLTGLDQVFQIFGDENEAAASFRTGAD